MSSDAGVGFNDRLLKYVDAQHQETSRKLLADSTYSGYDEAIHHPMKLATEAVIGGAATVAIALAAPEVAAVATTV